MPHESEWTRAAEDEFIAQATDLGYHCLWTKVSDNDKRGIPDVWAFCAIPGAIERCCTSGPGAWIEFKKATKWPTPVQAARIFSLAAKGCPAYLIRMPSRVQMELYRPVSNAGEMMWKHKPPFRQLWVHIATGSWAETLKVLAMMMATT